MCRKLRITMRKPPSLDTFHGTFQNLGPASSSLALESRSACASNARTLCTLVNERMRMTRMTCFNAPTSSFQHEAPKAPSHQVTGVASGRTGAEEGEALSYQKSSLASRPIFDQVEVEQNHTRIHSSCSGAATIHKRQTLEPEPCLYLFQSQLLSERWFNEGPGDE